MISGVLRRYTVVKTRIMYRSALKSLKRGVVTCRLMTRTTYEFFETTEPGREVYVSVALKESVHLTTQLSCCVRSICGAIKVGG